ncbi:MAG: right-handed parallel beta-helix repeat-containing protein [Saprospiraceae bacterium]|nr:right-handed parallel beta-helix repeat-containing protein [Saprospiraceae bacterium]
MTVTNTGGGTGSVTITNSTISNNTPARIGAASPLGGGIFVGTATAIFMTNCTVSGNSVAGSAGLGEGGGIFIFGPGGAAGQSSLTNCVISSNTSPFDGGGIRTAQPLTISGTTFSGNNADEMEEDYGPVAQVQLLYLNVLLQIIMQAHEGEQFFKI